MILPDPGTCIVSHGLTKDECVLLANIILTWAAAEDELGNALLHTYGITEGDVAADLVNGLDGKKKRDLLRKVLRRSNPAHSAIPILTTLAKAAEDWADDRNILAHGFGAITASGTVIVSSKPKPPLSPDRFNEILNRANWLYLASSEVRRIVVGTPSDDPLPNGPA
jgi:hypothetical protein